MNGQRLTAFLLIIIGVLILTYGGFSYVKETHRAEIGAFNMSFDEKQYVNVPVWMGIGVLVIGGILLIGRKV